MSVYNYYSQHVNSPIIVGRNNSVIIDNKDDDLDWELVQDKLIEVSGKLPKTSEEYVASKKALSLAMSKDKKGLVDCLKKNMKSFTSDIFKATASDMLVEIIKILIL